MSSAEMPTGRGLGLPCGVGVAVATEPRARGSRMRGEGGCVGFCRADRCGLAIDVDERRQVAVQIVGRRPVSLIRVAAQAPDESIVAEHRELSAQVLNVSALEDEAGLAFADEFPGGAG